MPVVATKMCLRCFDFREDAEFDGCCSAYCRDKAELEAMGISKLSAPSAEEYQARRLVARAPIVTEVATCTGIIPNTFIVCGEGGHFCSDACWAETLSPEAVRMDLL